MRKRQPGHPAVPSVPDPFEFVYVPDDVINNPDGFEGVCRNVLPDQLVPTALTAARVKYIDTAAERLRVCLRLDEIVRLVRVDIAPYLGRAPEDLNIAFIERVVRRRIRDLSRFGVQLIKRADVANIIYINDEAERKSLSEKIKGRFCSKNTLVSYIRIERLTN